MCQDAWSMVRQEVGRDWSRQERVVRVVWVERPAMWGMELWSRRRVWRPGKEVMERVERAFLERLRVVTVAIGEEGERDERLLSPGRVSWDIWR